VNAVKTQGATADGRHFKAIVMGGSAGAMKALEIILSVPAPNFALPVLLVQHLHSSDGGAFARHLACATRLLVVEPCDKARIEPGRVYAAPANYHMLVDRAGTISLSVDERVNWSRPSIDVLFESAVAVWGGELVAVILSGASADGANGMQAIKMAGGLTIAQEPGSAEHPFMPRAAIEIGAVDEILRPAQIGELLMELGNMANSQESMRFAQPSGSTGEPRNDG
jgi:two-component system, chemotaxis family, protein-glutamate methylesterase/glutaminase